MIPLLQSDSAQPARPSGRRDEAAPASPEEPANDAPFARLLAAMTAPAGQPKAKAPPAPETTPEAEADETPGEADGVSAELMAGAEAALLAPSPQRQPDSSPPAAAPAPGPARPLHLGSIPWAARVAMAGAAQSSAPPAPPPAPSAGPVPDTSDAAAPGDLAPRLPASAEPASPSIPGKGTPGERAAASTGSPVATSTAQPAGHRTDRADAPPVASPAVTPAAPPAAPPAEATPARAVSAAGAQPPVTAPAPARFGDIASPRERAAEARLDRRRLPEAELSATRMPPAAAPAAAEMPAPVALTVQPADALAGEGGLHGKSGLELQAAGGPERSQAESVRASQASAAQLPQAPRQVAIAIAELGEGQTEIRLSPEDLGRVRLTVASHDGAVLVQIAAERPETADLLRRASEQLAQELGELGYREVSIEFSFGPGAGQRQDARPDDLAGPRPATPEPNAAPLRALPPGPRVAAGHLDIRL